MMFSDAAYTNRARIGHAASPERRCRTLLHLSFIDGSPNRIHVRRMSMSLTADFAFTVASPRVNDPAVAVFKTSLNICWLSTDCSVGTVIPDEAQTATAPPRPFFIRDSARLSNDASWK